MHQISNKSFCVVKNERFYDLLRTTVSQDDLVQIKNKFYFNYPPISLGSKHCIWRYQVITHPDGTVDNLAPVLILVQSGLVKDASGQYSAEATADLLNDTISKDIEEYITETPTSDD